MIDEALRWYTVEEAAKLCRRHVRTIRNLLAKHHEIKRRRLWETRWRKRRRIIFLDAEAVRQLQGLTLGAPRSDWRPRKLEGETRDA